MAKNPQTDGESRKKGTSPRTRAGKSGRKQGTPRIMLVALVVIVMGAAFLFWPKGGSSPTGIGEQHSVVTAPDSNGVGQQAGLTGAPRSGDVDINDQGLKMTPEKPVDQDTENSGDQKPAEKPVEKISTPKPETKPVTKKKTPAKPAAPPIEPASTGSWAVQTGGFGDAANADREADRLGKAGWKAMVRTGNNSSGDMVFRVWIGYFASRDQANTFISQNRKHLPDAYVVHR